MDFLKVTTTSKKTVIESFDKIANKLFYDYQLQVNHNYYRLIDIEFYYYTDDLTDTHKDIYIHKHLTQRHSAKWYFHDSGIDITFGNNSDHYGGILIRGIAKIEKAKIDNNFITSQIHGPIKVRSEITESFNNVFDNSPNVFCLFEINNELEGSCMPAPLYVVKTNRINLNPQKDNEERYFDSKYRYVILLDKCQFGYTNKTQIAKDLQNQYDLTREEVNKLLGSKFL